MIYHNFKGRNYPYNGMNYTIGYGTNNLGQKVTYIVTKTGLNLYRFNYLATFNSLYDYAKQIII